MEKGRAISAPIASWSAARIQSAPTRHLEAEVSQALRTFLSPLSSRWLQYCQKRNTRAEHTCASTRIVPGLSPGKPPGRNHIRVALGASQSRLRSKRTSRLELTKGAEEGKEVPQAMLSAAMRRVRSIVYSPVRWNTLNGSYRFWTDDRQKGSQAD